MPRCTSRLLLAFTLATGTGLVVTSAARADVAPPGKSGTKSSDGQQGSDSGTPWGAILAGCLGVGFGGLIAAWQIKGLAKRR